MTLSEYSYTTTPTITLWDKECSTLSWMWSCTPTYLEFMRNFKYLLHACQPRHFQQYCCTKTGSFKTKDYMDTGIFTWIWKYYIFTTCTFAWFLANLFLHSIHLNSTPSDKHGSVSSCFTNKTVEMSAKSLSKSLLIPSSIRRSNARLIRYANKLRLQSNDHHFSDEIVEKKLELSTEKQ